MNFRFGVNTVLFLGIVVATVIIWTAAEFYHQQGNVDIPEKLKTQAYNQQSNPVPTSFDKETLKKLYQGKEKYINNGSTQN